VSRQIRMMLNKDDSVLIDILCIFTFNNFYHLLKKFWFSSVSEKSFLDLILTFFNFC
jgi:hypothetical protein